MLTFIIHHYFSYWIDILSTQDKTHYNEFPWFKKRTKILPFFQKQSIESFLTRYLSVSDSRKVSNFSFMFPHPFLISYFFFLSVKTCGKPHIQNIMSNVTAKPGQMATFKCQVDMSCIVAYIEWYHEMDNGTEKLIKVRLFQTFLCQLSITDCQLVIAILF